MSHIYLVPGETTLKFSVTKIISFIKYTKSYYLAIQIME